MGEPLSKTRLAEILGVEKADFVRRRRRWGNRWAKRSSLETKFEGGGSNTVAKKKDSDVQRKAQSFPHGRPRRTKSVFPTPRISANRVLLSNSPMAASDCSQQFPLPAVSAPSSFRSQLFPLPAFSAPSSLHSQQSLLPAVSAPSSFHSQQFPLSAVSAPSSFHSQQFPLPAVSDPSSSSSQQFQLPVVLASSSSRFQ